VSQSCESSSRTRSSGPNSTPAVDIAVQVPDGIRLNAAMVSGDVTVTDVRADVNATTVSGDVAVQPGGSAVTATTVSGDVRVALDVNGGAEFDVSTVSGRIQSDLPMTTTSLAAGPDGRPIFRGGPKSFHATIGGGGPEIRATTVSGDVTVRRR
jgi:DUF4097 and DUF4098 domain-containing protein YvlB